MELRKNDLVQVISGNDKGTKGRIVRIFRATNKIVVEGVNVRKRRLKPSQQNPQGGIIPQELPIPASKVMLIDPKSGTPTRVRHLKIHDPKLNKDRWIRAAAKSGEIIQ
ncbi:MAG TPA: 50S ribosomal protein L24 [Candidatus Kapabacteria bacterium]|nr:50S ribosomal protein L24 [Candidatus Kapabacteria bacterium]